MKKFLTIMLSVIMLLSIVVTSGCKKDIFSGNYQKLNEVDSMRVFNNINTNINWKTGYSINYYKSQDFWEGEVFIEGEMTTSLFNDKAVGEWTLKQTKEDVTATTIEEKTTMTTYLYDGIYTYKTIELSGKTQKTKGTVGAYSYYNCFDKIISKLDLNRRIVSKIDGLLKYSLDKEYYLDEDEEILKLRIEGEFEQLNIVFDKKINNIVAAKYEYKEIRENSSTGEKTENKTEFDIEKWDGEITYPSDIDEYIDIGENMEI